MAEKILYVDDDKDLLSVYKHRTPKPYEAFAALGAEHALALVASKGPFAVVVADMHMPGMNGLEFLAKVKELATESVRIMITADETIVVNAVNEVNIFRFLTKPCSPERLIKVIEEGVRQYSLITSEKELLEKTLRGNVNALCEVLSLTNPQVFSRSMRIKRYVRHIISQLKLANVWQYEVAAMLSQVGCVTCPNDILKKVYGREELTLTEKKMFESHPSVTSRLLGHIPRMELIAGMIEGQLTSFTDFRPAKELTKNERVVAFGSQMLKVTLDFELFSVRAVSHEAVLDALFRNKGQYNPNILKAFSNYPFDKVQTEVKSITLSELEVGMAVDEDIKSKKGSLLIPKGNEVTQTALSRLQNFSEKEGVGIKEPFKVRIALSDFLEQ